MLAKSKKIFGSIFTEIQNVYMQHKPYVSRIVDSALKGRISGVDFPSTSRDASTAFKPSNVIVFIIGGATFEEAADLSTAHNQEKDCVILGGTTVQNSKSFIADILSTAQLNGQPVLHAFEVEK